MFTQLEISELLNHKMSSFILLRKVGLWKSDNKILIIAFNQESVLKEAAVCQKSVSVCCAKPLRSLISLKARNIVNDVKAPSDKSFGKQYFLFRYSKSRNSNIFHSPF